jgi:uncharacterized damage-inducible protein DinB
MATNEFQRLLLQNAAFTPPLRIVAGIPADVLTIHIPNVPHSIAEELWHIVYWQDHFLRWARREDLPYPQHAELGWHRIDSYTDSQWQELVARFETGLTEAVNIAGRPDLSECHSTLQEPGSEVGPLSLLELIASWAVHSAYHLGRIVQLRQFAGNWPPPLGGDTW